MEGHFGTEEYQKEHNQIRVTHEHCAQVGPYTLDSFRRSRSDRGTFNEVRVFNADLAAAATVIRIPQRLLLLHLANGGLDLQGIVYHLHLCPHERKAQSLGAVSVIPYQFCWPSPCSHSVLRHP